MKKLDYLKYIGSTVKLPNHLKGAKIISVLYPPANRDGIVSIMFGVDKRQSGGHDGDIMELTRSGYTHLGGQSSNMYWHKARDVFNHIVDAPWVEQEPPAKSNNLFNIDDL